MIDPIPASSRCGQLYKIFQKKFPNLAEGVKLYGPFDRVSLKVETADRRILIFTYEDEKNWGLQTYKNYVDGSMLRR